LAFVDRPFQPEPILGSCRRSGCRHVFLNAIPQEDGSLAYEISDQGYMEKLLAGKTSGPLFVEKEHG
jgi:alpha-D-ribose 1-methylphosphonate 5-phosphate C-P lyase